jgi:ribonuclease HII
MRPAGLPPPSRLSVREIAALLGGEVDERWLRRLSRDARAGVRRLAAQALRRRARGERERARLEALLAVEQACRAEGFVRVAGVDEAGVAPLAGPVVAAAVILPEGALVHLPGLNDSKVLPADRRAALYAALLACGARVGLGVADVGEIDRLNILQATRLAWRRAVLQLQPPPDFVLVDGRYRLDLPLPQEALVDGDARCAAIAAASIVAKVTRDAIMRELDARYPGYGFALHKGYATRAHVAAIRRLGLTPEHRRSFLTVRVLQEPLFPELDGRAPR